jgi:hypothetical protein
MGSQSEESFKKENLFSISPPPPPKKKNKPEKIPTN